MFPQTPIKQNVFFQFPHTELKKQHSQKNIQKLIHRETIQTISQVNFNFKKNMMNFRLFSDDLVFSFCLFN